MPEPEFNAFFWDPEAEKFLVQIGKQIFPLFYKLKKL